MKPVSGRQGLLIVISKDQDHLQILEQITASAKILQQKEVRCQDNRDPGAVRKGPQLADKAFHGPEKHRSGNLVFPRRQITERP